MFISYHWPKYFTKQIQELCQGLNEGEEVIRFEADGTFAIYEVGSPKFLINVSYTTILVTVMTFPLWETKWVLLAPDLGPSYFVDVSEFSEVLVTSRPH